MSKDFLRDYQKDAVDKMRNGCRINRMNTPYKDLYYYHIKSRSGIDMAITKALNKKKNFNERKFAKWE